MINKFFSLAGTSKEYFPFDPVVVPIAFPKIETVAPSKIVPLDSLTIPNTTAFCE